MRISSFFLISALPVVACAQSQPTATAPPTVAAAPAKPAAPKPPKIPPTEANVRYGPHERNVLDFYRAKSEAPTPLVLFIHGGGWVRGDKASPNVLKDCLQAGISVVSMNYRFIQQAMEAGVKPPVKAPLMDAARALQFIRSKAKEWNLDKERIGASGGSAGACSSLWLAFHNDMADPQSADPVARESTRLWCAAVSGAQTSLDPKQLKEWTPNSRYGGHAFGFMSPDLATRDKQFPPFLENREKLLPWIKEYSPYELASADDPPVYLTYVAPPNMGQVEKDPTHTANYGVGLQRRLRELQVPCELHYPGAPDAPHATTNAYLIQQLKAPQQRP
jgi:acetyl esterase/lipase